MTIKVEKTSAQVTIDPDKKLGYRGDLNAEGKPGRANATSLKSVFKGSPLPGYTPGKISVVGEKDDIDMSDPAEYKKWFFENVSKGQINDEAYGLGTFNLDYRSSPNLDDVKTGAAGLPSTPFVPNPVSPGEGSVRAEDQAEAPAEFVAQQTPSSPFVGSDVSESGDGTKTNTARNPVETAKVIKDRLIQ